MSRLKRASLILFILVIAAGIVVLIIGLLSQPSKGKLTIESDPASEVFVDGQPAGKTPYSEEREQGEVLVKLVPVPGSDLLVPYETRVKIEAGVETIVRHKHGENQDQASGTVISFEKIPNSAPAIAVVTIPKNADVVVDGIRYSAPVKLVDLSVREYVVEVSSSGYSPSLVSVVPQRDHLLTLQVDLARGRPIVVENEKEANVENIEEELVVVKDNELGFLRVREAPSVSSSQIAIVEPGDELLVLGQSADGNWYNVRTNEDSTGWVSVEFVTKVVR